MAPRYLSQTDAVMWTIEADPMLRSTIMGVVLLDRTPSWERLSQRMEHVVRQVPALRQTVVAVPMRPGALQWQDDPAIDLGYHLRRVGAPGDGSLRSVLDLARSLAAVPFDRARPLWEFTLVEDLADGAALLLKAHHVVADGIGAVQLAAHLFDLGRRAKAPPRGGALPAAPRPAGALGMLRKALGDMVDHDVRLARGLVNRTAPALLATVAKAISDPAHTVADVVETAKSMGRVIAPVTTMASDVMTQRGMSTHYDVLDVDFDALHRGAAVAGTTLNDVFLGGITGGLRRYHEAMGSAVDELRVAMPISLRTKSDDVGGNHITVLRFSVPAGLDDPLERVKALHDVGQQMRHERSLAHTETIAGVVNLMPRGFVGSMLKKVDFLASNVPGVPVPIYLCGSPVTRFYPFGPTSGSALNVTLMSYDGTCCIGVHLDTAAVTDVELMMSCLAEGFDEMLALADRG